MIRRFFAIALLVMGISYLALSLFIGPHGSSTVAEFRRYQSDLQAHNANLEALGEELTATAQALETDRRRLRLEARALGYYAADEGIVHIVGYHHPPSSISPGSLLQRDPTPIEDRRPLLRTIALCIGLGLFLILSSTGGSGSRR